MPSKLKKNIIALACCLTMNPATIHAKSLFGDYSCNDWGKLENAPKKLWANAFFAPLSLTYKSIKKPIKIVITMIQIPTRAQSIALIAFANRIPIVTSIQARRTT